MMEVAVLIENSAMEGFACEHGLSFFIRFREGSIFWMPAAPGRFWKTPGGWGFAWRT